MSAPRPSPVPPRDEVAETMRRIERAGLTTTSGGNVSRRGDDGAIWITPAGGDKGSLRGEDVARVGADGRSADGPRPSSELPMHEAIYRARPDLAAIVHAHSTALVAFSLGDRTPDTAALAWARRRCGVVHRAPYALTGTAALGRRSAEAFAGGGHCVLLENHGVVVAGVDLPTAFARLDALELTARILVNAARLGPPGTAFALATASGHPPAASSGPDPHEDTAADRAREAARRRELSTLVRRGWGKRLLTGTTGTFSARLDTDGFLLTPSHLDREVADEHDLVRVATAGDDATRRTTRLHRAVYRRHPEIAAVMTAAPAHATAFCLTGARFESRTIPESHVLLGDVVRVEPGLLDDDPAALADLVGPDRPVALVAHEGAVVLGTSPLDALDRLEVLEATAETLLAGAALGGVVPLGDDAIAELDAAFGRRPS